MQRGFLMKNLLLCRKAEFPQRPCGLPTDPGSMTQRSCVYFGVRYILGPVKEAIHLVHGSVGCAYHGKMVRGIPMSVFSTDMQEYDVIFGGEKKLYRALYEVFSLNPNAKGVFLYLTCVSAMIGEDAESIAKKFSKETGKEIRVILCPGFSAPSQSKGHKLAYKVLFSLIKPVKSLKKPLVNLIGEYNVAGETQVIKALLSELGIRVNTVLTGDTSWSDIEKMNMANLNLLFCGSTAEDFCKDIKSVFGIPYIKVSFYGLSRIRSSLKKIAEYFGISSRRVDKVIKNGEEMVYKKIKTWLKDFYGKKAVIVLGAGRLGPLSKMLDELGLEVELSASIFGRKEDHLETMFYSEFLTDDPGDDELERFLITFKPDIVFINNREQWRPVKLGFPAFSFPQPKERGPYAGYIGMINFARDLYKCLKAPVWNLI